jgi:4'-phosphopantetheinyl transferase EntD
VSPVIDALLPPAAECAEDFGAPGKPELFPAEEAVVARAVEKRRREFSSVRCCARAALGRIGMPPVPILPGERGAPRWPAGIVGSMTHCAGYRAAAVARSRDLLTVGIDAEPDEPLPDGVLSYVSLPGERAMLQDLRAVPGASWDRLLFGAKESVYKAWFPLAGRWLGFEDAEVSISPADGTWRARLLISVPQGIPATFTGRWLAASGILLTVTTVPTNHRRL